MTLKQPCRYVHFNLQKADAEQNRHSEMSAYDCECHQSKYIYAQLELIGYNINIAAGEGGGWGS